MWLLRVSETMTKHLRNHQKALQSTGLLATTLYALFIGQLYACQVLMLQATALTQGHLRLTAGDKSVEGEVASNFGEPSARSDSLQVVPMACDCLSVDTTFAGMLPQNIQQPEAVQLLCLHPALGTVITQHQAVTLRAFLNCIGALHFQCCLTSIQFLLRSSCQQATACLIGSRE